MDTNCENDALSGSALGDTGFQCSINATTRELVAYGFPALAKNNLVVLKARLDNPATSITISNFVIETHYINNQTLGTLIAQGNTPAPPIVGVTPSTIQYWDDQYLQRDYLYAEDIGPVDFLINLPTALATTDTLIVEIPTNFTLAPEGQPYCLWNGVRAYDCVWDFTSTPNILKISSPYLVPIAANTDTTLRLTSLNADLGKNGLVLPNITGKYDFVFKTSPDGGATIRESQKIGVTVYAKKFILFYSTTEIINYNLKTSIKVEFIPQTTIPVGGRLVLYIPTLNENNGAILFNDDLRSGIADGGLIPCHDVSSSFGFEPKCILKYGNRQLGLPVQIEVTNWTTPLVKGSKYIFRVNKVYNPPESGDNKHVIMRLESYSGSTASSVINAGLHYDFTIQKFDPTVVNAATAPTTNPPNAGQAGVTFGVRFYSDQISRYQAKFDYFILEFPTLIPQPLGLKCVAVTNNDCVSLPGNNWVVYDKSDADVPATTYLPTLILGAQQVIGVIPNTESVLKSYSVRDRIAITQVVYPAIDYSTLVLQNITTTITAPDFISTQIPYLAPVQFMMSFTIPSGSIDITIPASGAIDITLPATLTPVDQYCVNDDTSQMTGDYTCKLSGQIYTISGFDQLNATKSVVITFWAQATTTSITPIFKLAFYNDITKVTKIAENTYITGPTISAYRGFQKIYPTDIEAINTFAVRANDVAPFKFYLTPGTSFADPITVKFPSSVSLPTGASLTCGFDSYEAKSCTVTSSSPLTIQIESPHTPTLVVSQTYQVFITTFGSTATSDKGLLFTTAGKDFVEVTVNSNTQKIPFEVYTGDFTSLIVRPFWSNVGIVNNLAVELQPSTLIPTDGKIVIEFPQYAIDGTALFAADLGTGQSTGTTIFCTSETKSVFIPTGEEIVCTLYYITGSYTAIEITGFKDVSTTSAIEFFIAGFKNPSIADSAHVHLEIYTVDSSGIILNKRLVQDVLTSQTVTVTSLSSTYTRSKNIVQETGATYTLSSMTAVVGKSITTRSTIVIKFPDIFTIDRTISVDVSCGGTAASTSFKTYANYIVITPLATFPAGAISITLTGITNPISKEGGTSAGIRVYFVYYRSYETEIAATANPAVDFTPGTILLNQFTNTSFINGLETDFTFELDMDKKIPAGGAIKITFPSFQAIKEGSITASLKSPVTFSTATSGINQTATFVLGKSYDPTDGNLVIKISATAPASAGNYTIALEALQSSTNSLKTIATGTQSWTIPKSYTLSPSAKVSLLYVEASQTTSIQVSYKLASTTTTDANTEIHIDIGQFTDPGLYDCIVNGAAPTTYCQYNGTVLVMKGVTLYSYPSTNTITFSLTSPSTTGITRLNILTTNITRDSNYTGSDIAPQLNRTDLDVGTVYLRVFSSSFPGFSLTSAHNTVSQPNFLDITFVSGSNINSPVFYVELPGFPATLGSYSNGNSIPCVSTTHPALKCTLETASGYKPVRIRVDGLSILSSGDSVTLKIFRITSPSSAGSYDIYFAASSLSVANFENIIHLGSNTITFASGTPTTTSTTLSLTDYTVRAVPSYDLSYSSISLSAGDLVFYHMPYTDYLVTPSGPTCTESCDYFPGAGVLTVTASSSISPYLNTASNLNNPPGTPTSSSNIIGYFVQSGVLTDIVTYSPSFSFTAATLASASLQSLQLNAVATSTAYLLSFTLGFDIPSGGLIRIYFPLSAFSAAPTASALRVIQGTYTGTLQLKTTTSSPNVYIDILGFTSFSAGPVVMSLNLDKGRSSSGTFTGSITSYLDSAAASSIETTSLSINYDPTTQKFYSYVRNLFVLGSSKTVKSGSGIWSFGFKQSAATGSLTVAGHKLKVIPPASFPFSSALPIRCKFTNLATGVSYLSQECYKNSFNQYEILPPSTANPLSVTEWRVSIFTISNVLGIPFPSSNIKHIFTVNIETSTSVVQETNILRFRVFDRVASRGYVDSYLNNINENNLVKFQMTLVNSIPAATGKLLIEFPMVNPTGTINSDSLYTGLTHRKLISCAPKSNNANITAKCRLLPGAAYEQKPTTVIVEDLKVGLSAGANFEVTLSIKNGGTSTIWTSARIVTIDSSNQLDLYTFEYVTYTSSVAATSITKPFPTGFTTYEVQSLTDFTLSVDPSSSINLLAADSRLRFTYNSDYYGGETQAVTSHTMELWANNMAFVTFLSDLGATPVGLTMKNFKNPVSIAPFTSSFQANVIKKKVIVTTINYNQAPLPTLTQGSFSSVTVNKDTDLKNQIAIYHFNLTLAKDIPVNGTIKLSFPSGYTLQTGTCTLIGLKSTSCSISGLDLSFTGLNPATAGTVLEIYVSATNPSTSGTTGAFSLFSYDAANYGIASLTTIPGTAINTIPAFNKLKVYELLTSPIRAQALDIAPLIFTVTLQSNLAKVTDYIDISFPTSTPEYFLPKTTLLMTDMVCRWGDLAASKCERITDGYRVYTPAETNLASGSIYALTIATNRYVPGNFDFPKMGSYVIDAKDSKTKVQSKTLVIPNEAFKRAYILSRITTNNEYSLLYMNFSTKHVINKQTDNFRGQIIIELPTLIENNINTFPVDLGKGVNNGDPVDCVANLNFTCKLSKGGVSFTAPASIIMDPQLTIASATEITVRLGYIKLPPNQKTYTPIRIYFRQYNLTSATWTILEEYLKDVIFYTTLSTIDTSEVNLNAPVFLPNEVGAPTTVTFGFDFKSTIGKLEPFTYDRLIIFTKTTYIRVQKEGVLCTKANVTTHQIAQWYEVEPTIDLVPSSTFTINFANWTNVPYVIDNGIYWEIYVWKDGNVRQKITYKNTTTVKPHDFQPTPLVVGFNSKTRAVTTYEISFLPYNQIPNGGTIEIGIPDKYMSLNPQCDILGLVDASCTIQDDGDLTTDDPKKFVLTGFDNYDPGIDGVIKLKVKMVNPKVGGSIGPFTLTTKYPGGYLIDQNLDVYNMTIDASATFYDFELLSLEQLQTKTCGGNPGPMKIVFTLTNSLYYPNDFITITLDKAFGAPYYEELLCYFKYNDIYNLKTHRCDWTTNQIFVYAPEEKNFTAGTQIELTITTRGANVKYFDGVRVPSVPGQYFVRVETSNSLEEGYPIANIPACPFKNFSADSIVWHRKTNTLLNFTMTATATLPAAASGGRLVIEVPTHNEIISTFLPDLGKNIPATDSAIPIGCGGMCIGCPGGNYLSGDQTSYVECTLMKAPGQNFGDRAIIFSTNLESIATSTTFNFQVARFENPDGNGWPYWTHMRIRTQKRASDGSYVDLNDHWAYFIVPDFLPLPAVTGTGGPAPSMQTSIVNRVGNFSLSNTPATLMDYGDFVLYEFFPTDFILPSTIACEQIFNVSHHKIVRCVPFNDSSWISVKLERNYSTFRVEIYQNFKQPHYTATTRIKGIYVKNHQIIDIINFAPYSSAPAALEIAMQTPSNINDVGLTLKYQIGMFPTSYSQKVKYYKLKVPVEWVNPTNCVVRRGLILKDVNNPFAPIQCNVTNSGSGYYIEIYDFVLSNDWWCIIDLTLTNPSTPGYTSTWDNWSFDNYNGSYTNISRIMDRSNSSDGTTWVGIKPFPNLFRVFRNTISFENRRAKENEYGEVQMRLVAKRTIPATTGKIEIWLPDEFDIPNGGDAICEVGNVYHTDLKAGSCSITSNRRIYMDASSVAGIQSGTCNLIRATTENSAYGNNGFQTAAYPGNYPFQVFMYNGSTLQEFSSPSSNVLPDPLSNLNVRVIDRETSFISVVRVSFGTPRTIPAGYDTDASELDMFKKTPIGTIFVDFNTLDNFGGNAGWPLTLGFTTSTDIPCKVISGITIRKDFSNIQCTLIASTAYNPKNPVRVTLSNFETIVEGTSNIEFHLLNLATVLSIYNSGQIDVGAYQTFGDGSVAQIIKPTTKYQTHSTKGTITPQIWNYNTLPSTFFTPHSVGSVLVVDFPYSTTVNLSSTDIYILKLPTQFDIPDDGSISAVIDGIQLTPYVYNDKRVNEIHFEFPPGSYLPVNNTVAQNKIVTISQLRDMAYADTANFTMELWVIKQAKLVQIIRYANIPPAPASDFNSLSLVLSSYFSGDVFVTYDFTIVPSYHIPAGSQFQISLPSPLYDHLLASQPSAICNIISTDLLENCTGSTVPGVSNKLTFTAKTRITESTRLSLQLVGVKNPTFIGTLPAGTLNMQVAHPNSKLINKGNFTDLTFTAPKSPDKISLDIGVTSLFKSVDADYTFSLQNSNQLPIGGKVILDFPSDWKTILPVGFTLSDLKSSFTNQALFYTMNYSSATGRLEITTQFAWPAKTSLYVKMNGLINPSNINTTGVFRSSTIYDSVTIDRTDPLDNSARITFETPPPPLNVTSVSFYPQNEGEPATYSLNLSPGSDIPSGSQIELIFPDSYGPLLTTIDVSITCSSPTLPNLECRVENGRLIVPINANITAGTPLALSISGITNPSSGKNNSISLMTRNGNTTLQFSSKGLTLASTAAPTAFSLSKLTTTSTNLQVPSFYEICAQTDQPIPAGAQVFVEFPSQFTIRQTGDMSVSVTSENDALIYPSGVSFQIEPNLRRFIITGQSNSLPGGTLKNLCYRIGLVSNPSDSGESNSFTMKVYDPAIQKILYRSYGTLSYPTTIVYKRVGLRILVDDIADFPVGLESDFVSVRLERSVPYEVQLLPRCIGFEFDPRIIYFKSDIASVQKFRIKPLSTTPAGSYYIEWSKSENSTESRFAAVPNSFFNYVGSAAYNRYRVILGTTVSRTALRGTSLPISVRLTQSPAKNMTISYKTIKPTQEDYVKFKPETLVFQPGELEKTFQYTTFDGAVSGLIQFELQAEFENLYYMEVKQLNFEILDIDNEAPEVLNEYIVTMDRTYMYYRISTSESAWVYYMLTLKGTVSPPPDEIKTPALRVVRKTKTDVIEISGRNSSYQASITKTYIYHDIYVLFTGLEEQTDYLFFYVIEDLSGNFLRTRKVEFTTFKKHHPARFNLLLKNDVNLASLQAAFSLVTGLSASRWQIIQSPKKFNIPDNSDPLIQTILDQGTVTYDIMLQQNATSDEKRPIETVGLLETSKYLLINEVPELVEDYDINKYSYEVVQFEAEFSYRPILLRVTEDAVMLNISIKRNGTLYGLVLPKGSTRPNARQIKYGLNAFNFKVDSQFVSSIEFTYPEKIPFGVRIHKIMNFSDLFDNTEYEAHFIAENKLPVNPDLMKDDDIMTISFLTQRELFVIPDDYEYAASLTVSKILLAILVTLILIL